MLAPGLVGTVGLVDIVREAAGGVEVVVWVVPGANRNEVSGVHDGALRVRVAAPPSAGQANGAVAKLLGELTGGRARVIRGSRSRRKTVVIEGIALARVRSSLGV